MADDDVEWDDDVTDEERALATEYFAERERERAAIDLATVQPMHCWNDPDGDGHTCVDCPPESIWKCDERAHDTITDPIEQILGRHLPLDFRHANPPGEGMICMCNGSEIFAGPVFYRRHVVGIIRAHLEGRLS